MKWIYSTCIMLLFTGCGKFLADYSQDLVVPKTVQDLDEILLGNGYLPRKEVSELFKGGLTWWTQLLDDDINTVAEQQAVRGSFEMDPYYFGYTTWQLEVGRSFNGLDLRADNADWQELYKRINAMNIVLAELDKMPQEFEKDKMDALRIKGESYFLRAQFYLTLVNLYAPMYSPSNASATLGVPMKLTNYVEHDNQKDTQFERSSLATVYAQIIRDLQASAEALGTSPQQRPGHRASQEAALLLLSRVHLYMQDWVNAELIAQQVIALNPTLMHYGTIGAQDAVINASNPEILFSQGPLNVQNVITGRAGDFCVSKDLYALYTADDLRKNLYFTKAFISDSVALNRKFKQALHISPVSDLFMLRTAEAYLNTIEALAMQDKRSEAQGLLNRFRGFRMSKIPSDAANIEELIVQIREERRKEFCFEGHRWFDLRRYAVSEKQNFKKDIIRMFHAYDWNDKNKPLPTYVYKLSKDDLAYTFAIPKSVLEFDRGMLDNPREMRKPIETIEIKK